MSAIEPGALRQAEEAFLHYFLKNETNLRSACLQVSQTRILEGKSKDSLFLETTSYTPIRIQKLLESPDFVKRYFRLLDACPAAVLDPLPQYRFPDSIGPKGLLRLHKRARRWGRQRARLEFSVALSAVPTGFSCSDRGVGVRLGSHRRGYWETQKVAIIICDPQV